MIQKQLRGLGFLIGALLVAPLHASPAQIAPAEIAPQASQSLLIAVTRAGDRLVTVGSRGHILVSDDEGARWNQVEVPVNNLLTAAFFEDAQRGWVVGHDATILFTEDGGSTWAVQHFNASMHPLFDVTMFGNGRGLAIGAYGLAMQTEDGGAHWEQVDDEVLTESGMHLNAIARLADQRYVIVGESGYIAQSTDAGQSWSMLESPYESSLFSVAAHGPSGIIMGGLRGNVFATANLDEGEWSRLDTNSVQSIFGISEDGQGGYWLAGLNGTLLHVDAELAVSRADTRRLNGTDGGDDVLITTAIGGIAYSGVMALGADRLVVVGGSGVQRMAVNR